MTSGESAKIQPDLLSRLLNWSLAIAGLFSLLVIAAATIGVIQYGIAFLALRKLKARFKPISDINLITQFELLQSEMGIRRSIYLVSGPDSLAPTTFVFVFLL